MGSEQGVSTPTALDDGGELRRRVRVARRAAGLGLVTCGLFVVWSIGVLPALALGRRLAWRDEVVHRWGRLGLAVLGVRLHVTGAPPPRGSLLVSNHLSYLDILVLASQVRGTFLSKAEVGDWPVLGRMARWVGILFVKREDRRSLPEVARRLSAELEAGHTVVLFPEGTSSRGAEVLPFRASLLAPAADGPTPVAHATLGYRIPRDSGAASDLVCWWGDMTFVDHLLGLLELPYIDADLRFGADRVQDRDRKALARRLWEAVQAQFEPVR